MALKTVTFNYTGAVQTFVVPQSGLYKLECWGESGGIGYGNANPFGLGGYACGEVLLTYGETLYIYVGEDGKNMITTPSFNGGGASFSSSGHNGGRGGGASDIRRHVDDLYNRIIVAGGGGGAQPNCGGSNTTAGHGGGLEGTRSYNNGSSYPNSYANGGTQTAGGTAYSPYYSAWNYGTFGVGANSPTCGAGGGGGWYGGGSAYTAGGGGGSSYLGSLANASTTSGVNTGNGLVKITYDQDPTIYYLIKDGSVYLPGSKYFNEATKTFIPLDISTIKSELELGRTGAMNLVNSFTVNGVTYKPTDLIDFSKCKIGAMSFKTLTKLNFNYVPSDKALAKTNIKVKEKYLMTTAAISFGICLDVTTDKTKIDYFIDYGQAKSYKSSSILNKEMISDSFYANFKLNKPDSLLSSVTLYNKYYYKKLQESQMDVYDNFKDSAFVVFHDDYDLMLVNRIAKKELINYIETIDKF